MRDMRYIIGIGDQLNISPQSRVLRPRYTATTLGWVLSHAKSHRNLLVVIAVAAMLIIAGTGIASAHSWQTEVEQGDMTLGVSTTPEEPVAGMQTDFSASITDAAAEEGQANRTSYGGVTNKEVAVHVNGPDDIHDHFTAEIPEDDSHISATYMFPEAGQYTLTMVVPIDGEEYAFEFQRNVTMIPSRAEGEKVESITESVNELQQQNEELSSQVDELHEQNDQLQTQLEESNQDDSDESPIGAGLTVGIGLVAIAGGFVVGRRA